MTETYKRSVQTAVPAEGSSDTSLSLKSTEKKLKKIRKVRGSPLIKQGTDIDGQQQQDTMVPSKPPLVNAKAKSNQGGCFSCFCMPTVMGAGKNNPTK